MRSLRLLLAPLALVSPLAAGCGSDAPSVPPSAIAVVGEMGGRRTALSERGGVERHLRGGHRTRPRSRSRAGRVAASCWSSARNSSRRRPAWA